jgi:hypothetical protein
MPYEDGVAVAGLEGVADAADVGVTEGVSGVLVELGRAVIVAVAEGVGVGLGVVVAKLAFSIS